MEVLPSGLRGLGKTVPRLYHLVRVVGLFFVGLTAIFLQQAGEQEARRLTTLIHVFLALGKTEVEIAKQIREYHLGFLTVLKLNFVYLLGHVALKRTLLQDDSRKSLDFFII